MNFFGHAAVASWRSGDPSFVLGAMLPDFTSMIGARAPEIGDPALAEGVAFHHATDEVFHDVSDFRELCRASFDELSRAGLGRGAARAVAHIGVEILLDGVLAGEPSARQAYLAALRQRPRLLWRSEPEARAFDALLEAMRGRGISRQHTAPAVVAYRVERALAGRSRLALGRGETALVERWAESARHAVRERAPGISAELGARFRPAPPLG